jgi:hypothetical protein
LTAGGSLVSKFCLLAAADAGRGGVSAAAESVESRNAQGFREVRHSVKIFSTDFSHYAASNFSSDVDKAVGQFRIPDDFYKLISPP